MAYDMGVAQIAYTTANGLGASPKVMLALFEAMIVESGVKNIRYGDRDSQGVLQQRPSQGWGTIEQVTNVDYAVTQFVTRAKRIEKAYPTAGQLAQAVQRSAFPLRYDQQEANAQSLLTLVSKGNWTDSTKEVTSGGGGVDLSILTDSSKWTRTIYFSLGFLLLFLCISIMIKDTKISSTATKVALAVATKGVVK